MWIDAARGRAEAGKAWLRDQAILRAADAAVCGCRVVGERAQVVEGLQHLQVELRTTGTRRR